MRSSIAASDARSSARVSPRSVMLVAAISATTSGSVRGGGAHRARAAHVADRAVAHGRGERLLVVHQRRRTSLDRVEHPVAREDLALVGHVDRRQLELLLTRCTARRRARSSWRSGTRGCSRRGARARCRGPTAPGAGGAGPTGRSRRGSSARAPWRGRAPRRGGRRRSRRRARSARSRPAASTVCRRLRDARGPVSSRTRPVSIDSCTEPTSSSRLVLGDEAVAEGDDLGEVVAGVDVQQRERHLARREGLLGEPHEHDRVLAAAEQQGGRLTLGGDLAQHVDGLGLERAQVRERGRA